MRKIIFPIFFFCATSLFAQLKIGLDPTSIDESSILEIESTDKVVVPPRIGNGAARDALATNALEGALMYNPDKGCHEVLGNTDTDNDGSNWNCIGDPSTASVTSTLPFNILGTSSGCKISDYIPSGAPSTIITESARVLPSGQATTWFLYHPDSLSAAMDNNTIIGISEIPNTLISHRVLSLPDAEKHIGKTFLIYHVTHNSIKNPTIATSYSSAISFYYYELLNFVPDFQHEDMYNDYLNLQTHGVYTQYVTSHPRISESVALDTPLGAPASVIKLPSFQTARRTSKLIPEHDFIVASYFILTAEGKDNWRVECIGELRYDNPLNN